VALTLYYCKKNLAVYNAF